MSAVPGSATDADLWRLADSGSPEAWGDLFTRHSKPIYNFCFRRTGDWGVAEDLTSAVFMEAWRRRADVRLYGTSALPWLYGIATMLTRNQRRALRRYQRALARIPVAQAAPDPSDNVAARIDAQRQLASVRAAIRRLPRSERDVLELVLTGRLSHEEIATALGIAVGTVKSRLARARKRLSRSAESGRAPSVASPSLEKGGQP